MNAIENFRGQPAVNLCTPGGDRAIVLLHGAHVVSWTPAAGTERLYLSDRSAYGNGHAIRGGVPVIFPQFNQRGPDFDVPRHGFARTRAWVADEALDDAGSAAVTLRLQDDAETRALWPHPFSLTLTVSLGPDKLDLALGVHNPGTRAMEFTAALHTYLQVADIARVRVEGLQGVRYLDTTRNIGGVAVEPALAFDRETDRIYYEVPGPLSLLSPIGRMVVAMEGFRDTVVWNPWADRCAALPDMADDGYRQMLCIEAAAIDKPVRLDEDESWLGRQTLTACRAAPENS